jgi:hypothetical protein
MGSVGGGVMLLLTTMVADRPDTRPPTDYSTGTRSGGRSRSMRERVL